MRSVSTAGLGPRRRGTGGGGDSHLVSRTGRSAAGVNDRGSAKPRTLRRLARTISLLVVPGFLLLTVTADGTDAAPRLRVARCAKHEHQADRHPEKWTACQPLQTSGGAARGDFSGDGFGDLAIGVPSEDVGTVVDAGTVQVLLGGPFGPSHSSDRILVDNTGVESGDRFGAALAAGDFNGDGFSDLAVGRPGQDVTAGADGGAVSVFEGSPGGLSPTASKTLVGNQAGAAFGAALVWGRLGRGAAADLAVGAPLADQRLATGTAADAGEVHVHFGGPGGLADDGFLLRQGGGILGETPEAGDAFGSTLAVGDLAVGDPSFGGFTVLDELLIGTPSEDVGLGGDAGQVAVVLPTGFGFVQGTFLQQAQPEAGDRFGSALATANVDSAGRADLVVGVPFEDPRSLDVRDSGEVDVWFSAADGSGVAGAPNQVVASVGGNQSGARFGSALAANNFDGQAAADLAVGAPLQDVDGAVDSGKVDVFYGAAGGLGGPGALAPQVLGGGQEGGRFGSALSGWGFDGFEPADLAVGIPFADVAVGTALHVDAGRVELYFSRLAFGFSNAEVVIFNQNNLSFESAEAGDGFGTALY